AGLHGRSNAVRSSDFRGPDPRGETEVGAVGERNRLVVVPECRDREHGPEHLLTQHSSVSGQVVKDSRRNIEPASNTLVRRHCRLRDDGADLRRLFDELKSLVALERRDLWTHVRASIEWV